MVRRVGLLVKNEQGVYDKVLLYKSKKETAPLAELPLDQMVYNVIDEGVYKDHAVTTNRHYKFISAAEDGSQ